MSRSLLTVKSGASVQAFVSPQVDTGSLAREGATDDPAVQAVLAASTNFELLQSRVQNSVGARTSHSQTLTSSESV